MKECQKRINLLDNTWNQPSKIRTGNWDEINDESRRTYYTYYTSIVKLKTTKNYNVKI